jgi:hypothetical protein
VSNHHARCVLSAQQGAGHVDGHGRYKVVQRKVQEGENLGDACAIHEHVASVVQGLNLCKHGADRFRSADIQLNGLGPGALALKLSRQARGMDHVQIGNPNFQPATSQSSANLFADAFGATRDQGNS